MIKRANAVVVFALALVSGGCAVPVLTTIDHNTRFDRRSTDAIVVFGFSGKVDVWIYPGTDDGVNWHCQHGLATVTRVRPEGRFVVARLPARTGKDKYAIGRIGAATNVESFDRANSAVWVFNAEPGRVSYLGALRAVWSGGELGLLEDSSVTPDDADEFMTQIFPNIPDHVVTGRMDSIYVSMDNC